LDRRDRTVANAIARPEPATWQEQSPDDDGRTLRIGWIPVVPVGRAVVADSGVRAHARFVGWLARERCSFSSQ
jgi:hypothetical protein